MSNNVTSGSPLPQDDWDMIVIHERLFDLGFCGWRVKQTGVEFILPPTCEVGAGSFLMGSSDRDNNARDNEKPQHRISLGAFAIGAYPITVEEYRYFLKATRDMRAIDPIPSPYTFSRADKWGAPEWRGKELNWQAQQSRPDHPVACVSWHNAWDYATWLSKTTGQPWSLPTEVEWEKAARWDEAQQHARIYPWGDIWDKTRANTDDGGPGRTTAVGSYPNGASPSGAQDMAGNVWEWTNSLPTPNPFNLTSNGEIGTILEVIALTHQRVLRGGSWCNPPRDAGTAYRRRSRAVTRSESRGFRLACG